jgi:hypothetical protein
MEQSGLIPGTHWMITDFFDCWSFVWIKVDHSLDHLKQTVQLNSFFHRLMVRTAAETMLSPAQEKERIS